MATGTLRKVVSVQEVEEMGIGNVIRALGAVRREWKKRTECGQVSSGFLVEGADRRHGGRGTRGLRGLSSWHEGCEGRFICWGEWPMDRRREGPVRAESQATVCPAQQGTGLHGLRPLLCWDRSEDSLGLWIVAG